METQDRIDTKPAARGRGRSRNADAAKTSEAMCYVLVEKPTPGREGDCQLQEMLAKGYTVDGSYKSRTHTRVMIPERIRREREARAKANRQRKMTQHAAEHVNPQHETNMDLVREQNLERSGGALSVADIGALVKEGD